MLQGTIYMTDDIRVINTVDLTKMKIVSLDEDGILDPSQVIPGTCLLPPMEAKIAEADGNERLYDEIYCIHLQQPFQVQFMTALITFLYKGGSLMLYMPEINETCTAFKLQHFLFLIYGIHAGIVNARSPEVANCYFNPNMVPLWLEIMYQGRTMSSVEFLTLYPVELANQIRPESINLLIQNLRPYGNTIEEKVAELLRYQKRLHGNPNCKMAICSAKR